MAEKSEHRWSKSVTQHDHPLDLPPGIFKSGNPEEIAAALQRSAQDPERGSKDPYRSAMSMLDFYMNRAGSNLSAKEREALDEAKLALRRRFGRIDD